MTTYLCESPSIFTNRRLRFTNPFWWFVYFQNSCPKQPSVWLHAAIVQINQLLIDHLSNWKSSLIVYILNIQTSTSNSISILMQKIVALVSRTASPTLVKQQQLCMRPAQLKAEVDNNRAQWQKIEETFVSDNNRWSNETIKYGKWWRQTIVAGGGIKLVAVVVGRDQSLTLTWVTDNARTTANNDSRRRSMATMNANY